MNATLRAQDAVNVAFTDLRRGHLPAPYGSAHPGIPGTVEEVLRFDAPVQYLARATTCEAVLHDRAIPAGARMVLLYGAANRDPRRFERPDAFDIHREVKRTLAFGEGIHFCLGAALGRLEGQIALATISRRWPKLQLADSQVQWRPYPVFRGLAALRLKLQ